MADPTRIDGAKPLPITTETPAVRRANANPPAGKANPASGTSFAELLRAQQGLAPTAPAGRDAASALRFSAHAQTRLQSRHIALEAAHLDRLQGAVQRAANKGARDALVLMDDLAMVVSVTNRTVVTVVDKEHLKQSVFTNIDSAVIA
ncbi:MAG TPA: TIGR02530 family flagellar biosynthesis protein [Chthonomonadaceae bacterium]|nr:TIGR02530 family flagellar biosynthesis protein [Chthonomonadaceae bacterium]